MLDQDQYERRHNCRRSTMPCAIIRPVALRRRQPVSLHAVPFPASSDFSHWIQHIQNSPEKRKTQFCFKVQDEDTKTTQRFLCGPEPKASPMALPRVDSMYHDPMSANICTLAYRVQHPQVIKRFRNRLFRRLRC